MVLPANATFYDTLRQALFDHFLHGTSYSSLAVQYNISEHRLRRWYNLWLRNAPDSQPTHPHDISVALRHPGRPTALTNVEETEIVKTVDYYVKNNTPLSKNSLLDLVQCYVQSLSVDRQNSIGFFEGRPSLTWLDRFMQRHDLKYLPVRIIENARLEVTPEKVARHMALMESLMDRFHIVNPSRIFNVDESGVSASKCLGRSLRKGVGSSNSVLIQKAIRTKGADDRVTVMPVVSADGRAWKPIVVVGGKRAHYGFVNGRLQTLHEFLPPCYLYQREKAGVDSAIFFNWATNFVEETQELRGNGRHLLLVLDGYSGHIQFRTLKFFKDNRVIVVALPSHSSHILQPLDVSVFGPYKSYFQRELHRMSRVKVVLDIFDLVEGINVALSEALTVRNIRSGFEKTGIWVHAKAGPDVTGIAFSDLWVSRDGSDDVTVDYLVDTYLKNSRSLVLESDVDESGTVKVSTAYGAHLTANTVLEALRNCSSGSRMYENNAELQHLAELAPRRKALMDHLASTRAQPRQIATARATRQRALNAIVSREIVDAEAGSQGADGEAAEIEVLDCSQAWDA